MQKYIILVIVAAILAGLGYFAYQQYYRFYVPKGDLKVTLISAGKPVPNVEVDVNETPGPPKYRDETDKNGVVLFEGLPIGSYAIFFNKGNFPANLVYPNDTSWATVKQGQVKEKEIELQAK